MTALGKIYNESNMNLSNIFKLTLVFSFIVNFSVADELSQNYKQDILCGKQLPKFEETADKSCGRATYCSSPTQDFLICTCQQFDESDAFTNITVKYKGNVLKTLKTFVSGISYGPQSFRVDEFGYTKDGKQAFLLGVNSDVSNGIGIASWSVFAFSDTFVSPAIKMDDYGLMGFPTKSPNSNSCQLLVTRWVAGWDKEKGGGLYIVGRWYTLFQDELFGSYSRPGISSRYLYSLEKQRFQNMNSNTELFWYKNKAAFSINGPYPVE